MLDLNRENSATPSTWTAGSHTPTPSRAHWKQRCFFANSSAHFRELLSSWYIHREEIGAARLFREERWGVFVYNFASSSWTQLFLSENPRPREKPFCLCAKPRYCNRLF
jgi:hypothetical protein